MNGAIKYVLSFTCLVMSLLKFLVAIDQGNQIIQARKATINVEVSNLKSLSKDLKMLRKKCPLIFRECKPVASAANMQNELPSKQESKRRVDYIEIQVHIAELVKITALSEEERTCKRNGIYGVIRCVSAGLSTRYVLQTALTITLAVAFFGSLSGAIRGSNS